MSNKELEIIKCGIQSNSRHIQELKSDLSKKTEVLEVVLSNIEEQVKKTNGRVTRLEKISQFLIGSGVGIAAFGGLILTLLSIFWK